MEWMMSYNPKKRPRPSQILQHEFFTPKLLSSALQNKGSSKDTTAETTS
jgi:serine/threonine protein kinase